MRQYFSLKTIITLLVIAVIASAITFGEFVPSLSFPKKKENKELAKLTNPKVREIFCFLQKNENDIDECLCKLEPLTEHEVNIAYQTAVDLYKYKLAVKFYEMGATDCFKEGQDILWISINLGDFDLANALLKSDYPIHLYHINAVRSLINMDQPNWAYVYHKEDDDINGFKKYQKKSTELANKVIGLYKAQNKVEKPLFPKQFDSVKKYESLFGKKSIQVFQELVNKTLDEGYTFEYAKHGSQKTAILVDKNNKKIGIIKTRNELLAQAIDSDHFAGVPPIVEVNIPEKGNVIIQKWVANSYMVTDYNQPSQKVMLENINVFEELHRIRALDIRLGNSDRNRGNLLVKKCGDVFHLVPIDHDLLMHYIPHDMNWESPYLNTPFSDFTSSKIRSINLDEDEKIMRNLSYNSDEIRSMKIRTTILKMAVEEKLNLKEIDMLFRFFYYDFLDEAKLISASASEEVYRDALLEQFQKSSVVVSQPTEVWKLIGNNFEFYI